MREIALDVMRADGTVLYPVLQDIPVLLVEESIEITTVALSPLPSAV